MEIQMKFLILFSSHEHFDSSIFCFHWVLEAPDVNAASIQFTSFYFGVIHWLQIEAIVDIDFSFDDFDAWCKWKIDVFIVWLTHHIGWRM